MSRIAILDYGMGNLRSAEKALERVGAEAYRTTEPESAREADGLVLPGVGAFPEAMRRIDERGFRAVIEERVAAGVPLLGICLGMQLLFESSDELGGAEGLGLIDGAVTRLDEPGLKTPHIGWEPIHWSDAGAPLAEGIADDTPFYFVHSYAAAADGPQVLASAQFGATRFAAVVAAPPVYGAQFHPEKSSSDGLRMLANFTGLCRHSALAA